MSFIRHTKNEAETIKVGHEIARHIEHMAKTSPILPCLTLSGNLGMGKSVLARSIIRALMRDENYEVPSPTYTLVQSYELPALNNIPLYHFDLYRLDNPEDIFELGFDDARADGITLIEWPEKAIDYLPVNRLSFKITNDSADKERRIITSDSVTWE